jgi:hypothetical protein
VGKVVRVKMSVTGGGLRCSPVLPRTTAARSCVLLTVPVTRPAVLQDPQCVSAHVVAAHGKPGSHAFARSTTIFSINKITQCLDCRCLA